jgi:hypothetical protein
MENPMQLANELSDHRLASKSRSLSTDIFVGDLLIFSLIITIALCLQYIVIFSYIHV